MVEAATTTLSTSALAKRLKLPIQQLFVTLRDYGWIDRQGESWVLTGKGELHGGGYQNSPRYGRYIVWPETLIEHPLITAIESNQRIYAGDLSRYYPHLNPAQINRSLGELGLVRSSVEGLLLTPLGERFGGRQERDENHALAVVSWPHGIIDDPVIHRELNRLAGSGASPAALPAIVDGTDDAPADDLFASLDQEQRVAERRGLDGHQVDSLLQLRVCDWLYEAQFAHAHSRRLPVEEELSADFYVPAAGLYIECWESEVPTQELSRRLRTREVCRELGLAYLEVAAADIDRVDAVLAAALTPLLPRN
ncbi:MAG: hypothetical protein AAFY29_06185 [Pseudomonadota bacterium]